MAEPTGLAAAIREQMRGSRAPEAARAARQLPLIATVAAEEPEGPRRGPGRPAGARNRRTQEWTDYLLSQYRSPLVVLAETYSRPTADLAEELGLTRAEAFAMQLQAAKELAPYLHQRQPLAVNVDGKGVVALTLVAPPDLEALAEGSETPAIEGFVVESGNDGKSGT